MTEPVIDLLDEVWRSIDRARRAASPRSEWKQPSDLPGWTVQDNLSHIIGTERMMRGEPAPDVTPARTDHLHNPIGEMNELWVESRRHLSGADVLDEFRAVRRRAAGRVPGPDPGRARRGRPHPVGEAPFREFIAVRVMDSWAHEQDMRRAARPPGPPRRSRRRPLDRPGHQGHADGGGQAGRRA